MTSVLAKLLAQQWSQLNTTLITDTTTAGPARTSGRTQSENIDDLPSTMGDRECPDCQEEVPDNRQTKSAMCDLCRCWYHKKCQKIEDNIYKAIHSQEGQASLYWMCKHCSKVGKPLMDKMSEILLGIKATENKLAEETRERKELQEIVTDYGTRLAKLENKEEKEEEMKNVATTAVETYMQEYPPLGEAQSELKKAMEEHNQELLQKTAAKTKEEIDELNRRKTREKNLIFYNVIGDEKATAEEQMLADFNQIAKLYEDKTDIIKDDIFAISRLGQKKDNQIRPVRVSFSDVQKKNEVLRKNRDLMINSDQLETCSCQLKTKHIHVYVSNDRTLQQRATDKKLRTELKLRREAGEENLVIRNEKIVPFRAAAQPSWATVVAGDT